MSHDYKVTALACLDQLDDDEQIGVTTADMSNPAIIKPFLVSLGLMFLLQLCGQEGVSGC